MRDRSEWVRWLCVFAAATLSVAGCNMITGADDLKAGAAEGPHGSGAGSNSSGSTNPSAGGGGGVGVGGAGTGGSVVAPPEYAAVDGVAITDIDLYQGIRRPLVEDASAATSSIPVVAGKSAMLRVFYQTDGGYNGQAVTVRVTVGTAEPIEVLETLSGSSTQSQLGSTINVDLPGAIMTANADFKVELLQTEDQTSGTNSGATYPAGGDMADMEIEQGGQTLKILLVPVSNNGSLPDTSAEQVAKYKLWFAERYPVAEVEVTVRSSTYSFGGYLGSYNGWSNLLDSVTDLRGADNAPDDVYYYGIHDASGSGLLGLGWVGGSSDVWSRTAIGVGWTGNTAPETAVHELGHNHGRSHAPCGVSGDSNYPHSGAGIGVWGYSPSSKQLLDPNDYVDFMSYCDPAWISDYTFKAIFNRAKTVSAAPYVQIDPSLMNRGYERIKVLEGTAFFKDTITKMRPPQGEDKTVTVTTPSGIQTVTANYYPYNHIDGGVLYVMRPAGFNGGNWVQKIDFGVEGQTFNLSR